MARINFKEENSLPPKDFKSKFNPLKKERRTKRRSVKTNCFFLIGFLFIFILVLLFVMIIKAGIIEVPILSQIFYRVPTPSRLIVINNPESFIQKSANFQYDQTTKMTSIELTEEELTFVIRQNLAKQKEPRFAQNTQVVISDGEIEFFGLLLRPIAVNITLKAKVFKAEAGEKAPYSYQITQLKLGDLNLPPSLIDWLAHKYGQKAGAKYNSIYLNRISNLDKSKIPLIELKEGKLILKLAIDIEAIQSRTLNLFKIVSQLDKAEQEKLNNLDFDNLATTTVEKLKEIGLTIDQLKKLKGLNPK